MDQLNQRALDQAAAIGSRELAGAAAAKPSTRLNRAISDANNLASRCRNMCDQLSGLLENVRGVVPSDPDNALGEVEAGGMIHELDRQHNHAESSLDIIQNQIDELKEYI